MKTTSNSVFNIDTLKKDYESGRLSINSSYQRTNTAWTNLQKSALIYSILDNCPVGEFQITNTKPYHHDIVDGYQRISAICDFINNHIKMSPEDSNNLLQKFSSEFDEDSRILIKWSSGKNVRLKFENLPDTLKHRIIYYQINTKILSGWTDFEIREYFRRVQNGTPLTTNDKLYTVSTPITDRIKSISMNPVYLKALNLYHDNGKMTKSADRRVYGIFLEALYCASGFYINQAKYLIPFFTKSENHNSAKLHMMIDKIEEFLMSLNHMDTQLFRSSGYKTDLLLMFALVLLGEWSDISDSKLFIIKIVQITSSYSTWNNNRNDETLNVFKSELAQYGLRDFYLEHPTLLHDLSSLRASGHNKDKVSAISLAISEAFYVDEVTYSS